MNKNILISILTFALGACGCDPAPANTNPMMMDGSVTDVDSSVDVDAGVDSGMVVVVPVCGNGVVEGSEACDDGNVVTETCSYGQTSCTVCDSGCNSVAGAVSFCGDSVVNGAEECDDGNLSDTDACPTTCENATCGDGFVQDGVDECDDGDTNNTNHCSNSCAIVYFCRVDVNTPCAPGMDFTGNAAHQALVSANIPEDANHNCTSGNTWEFANWTSGTVGSIMWGDYVRHCVGSNNLADLAEMRLCYSETDLTNTSTFDFCTVVP